MHPGLAAKNGVLAAALADSGITASDQVVDGPISLAKAMGDHRPEKFASALAKLGKPWSIVEHGLFMKAYPSCGYSHRIIDAAIEIHRKMQQHIDGIDSIKISVPDYYLDLLIYPRPETPSEAMFSAQYNVAAALTRGVFGFAELGNDVIADPHLQSLCGKSDLLARKPRNMNIVYDPLDPDVVEVVLANDTRLRSEIGLPTGAPDNPMSESARRSKFDNCLRSHRDEAGRDELWARLASIDKADNLDALLASLSS